MNKVLTIISAFLATASVAAAQSKEETDSVTRHLQEVVVTARQPATKLVGNTLVSTIAGTPLQDLGTCLEVLAQLPMINVSDLDVSVVGKGTPEIFIDGRPMRDSEELRLLQSSNIRKVELLMAPGAMYAADTKAVLKISTKKNFLEGLSLTERAEVTARRKWSANDLLDLNYRSGHWDLFATGTVARNDSQIKGSTTNSLEYEGKETVVGSSQDNTYPSANATVKGGFNFNAADRSFGAYYRYNPERGDFVNTGSEWLDNGPRLNRDISRSIRSHSHLVSAYYDDTFAEKYNLHFDGNYRTSLTRNFNSTTYTDSEIPEVDSRDRRRSTLWAGKLYLSFPLLRGSFTAGTQDSYTHTSLDYKMLNQEVGQYIPSAFTDARQTSLAAFASWDRNFGRLSLSAGLRFEHIAYTFKTDGVRDDNLSRTDNLLTPDLSLGWTFSEDAQAGLSYRMSRIKPPYSQLTGSLAYTGRHEIEGGNPALRDECMHDIQLFGMWNNFILQADFTRSLDTYAYVKKLYPANTLQLLMQPVNIDVSAVDLYLVWSKNIKAWTPNVTLGMHKQWLHLGSTSYNRPIFSLYFENMISLPAGFLLSVNANGQTKGDMHTNRFDSTWFVVDASVSKSFLDKSLQLRLSATDIFNTMNNDWSMNTYGVLVEKRQSYDRRGVSLSISYRFNPRQSKYKGKNASESELNRL